VVWADVGRLARFLASDVDGVFLVDCNLEFTLCSVCICLF
jgi:hypothetical protein